MKNKVLCLFFLCFLLLLFSSCEKVPSEKTETEDYEIRITSDGTAEIVKFIGNISELTVIPSEYEGYPITKICDDAFRDSTRVKNVVIPESITEIGTCAFNTCHYLETVVFNGGESEIILGNGIFGSCENLKKVTLEGNIVHIPKSCFGTCINLSDITLPDTVKSYDEFSFARSGITEFTVPEEVTKIADYAFYECSSLQKIKLHDNVTYIGIAAFGSCLSLTEINIPASVMKIEELAFSECTSLTDMLISPDNEYYYMTDGMLIEKASKTVMDYCKGRKGENVIVPDDILSINATAFMDSDIVSISLPESISGLLSALFTQCYELTEISFRGDEPKYVFRDGMLIDKANNMLLAYLPKYLPEKDLVIPNGIEIIGNGVIAYTRLESIVFPESVKRIESFFINPNLKSITVMNKEAEIDTATFAYDNGEFMIYGYPDSTAEAVALKKQIQFESIE